MTWLPDWLAGQSITDDALNDMLDALPLFNYKLTDETITSDSTLTTDTSLSVTVLPFHVYLVDFGLVYATAAAADFKFTFAALSGATMTNWMQHWRTHDGTEVSGTSATLTTVRSVTATAGAGVDQPIEGHGVLITGSTGGTLGIQWAQNTSDVGNTSVRANSWIMAQAVL